MSAIPANPPRPPADFPVPAVYAGMDFPGVGTLHLWKAADAFALLDDPRYLRQFDECGELMPYWADLWPSAGALCRYLLANRERCRGSAVEIGAGLGVVGMVLARLGMRTALTDVAEDARRILAIHLRENGFGESGLATVASLDYFNPGAAGLDPAGLVVGSDILFEARNCRGVARTVAHLLSAYGVALIADPFRATAKTFGEELAEAGLSGDVVVLIPPSRAGENAAAGVRLFRICRSTCFPGCRWSGFPDHP